MTIDHGQFNTRERAVSNDLNRQMLLGNRGTVEALSAAVSGASHESGVLGDNAFLVTPQNGTMKSAIGPGVALYYDSTKVFPVSPMVWIESREIREVTHEPADGLARWDVIEMRPGEQVSSTQPRDQFDPLTGTFTVVNMPKEIQSWPEFQIRKGTPSASPAVPLGTAGWIPLAYVRVNGGAVAVVSTEVVFCRPLLSARGIDRTGWTTSNLGNLYASDVRGGGIDFDGGNNDLTGTLRNTMRGRFGSTFQGAYHHTFFITRSVAVKVTAMTIDGGVMPAADDVIYFYAVPPPYPAGYDSSMAGRELWTPDTDNLYGTDGGFYDSALQGHCLIIASAKEPDVQTPVGNPAAGVGTFAHEFFSDLGLAQSNCSSWVYIGAGFYSQATNEITPQFTRGAWVTFARKTGERFDADLPIGAPVTYNMWGGFAGAPMALPITAVHLAIQVSCVLGADDEIRIELEDTWTGQGSDNVNGAPTFILKNGAAGTDDVKYDFITDVTDAGDIEIASAIVTGLNGACSILARAYEDAVLSQR